MSIVYTISRYGLVGVVNTAVHWLVFGVCYGVIGANQAVANTVAFGIAVTVSFFLNARFTFKSGVSVKRYLLFVVFMGIVSFLTGYFADKVALAPVFTLVIFTAVSFVIGFIWSKFCVFKS